MLDQILARTGQSEAFGRVTAAVEGRQTAAVYDLCEGARVFLACWLHRRLDRQVLLVAASEAAAQRMAEDAAQLLSAPVSLLPPDMPEFVSGAVSRDVEYARLETLLRAQNGETGVTVTTAEANRWTIGMTTVIPLIFAVLGLVVMTRRKHS